MTVEPGYRIEAGATRSPVILHVPHASRRLTPLARETILLDDAALSVELDRMTDAYTDVIAARAAAAATVRPWMFVNGYSRLVADPERFPDEREEMRAVGMGAVYTRTSYGEPLRAADAVLVEQLLSSHFRPYTQAMSDLVDHRLAVTGAVTIVDVHSYPGTALPYELHGTAPRPPICLGTDTHHTPAVLRDAARDAFAGCGPVGFDTPFAGCYIPLKHYRRRTAVTGVMVEVRRDTYLTEPAGPPTDGLDRVVEALTRLIEAIP